MQLRKIVGSPAHVALLAEGVGRNGLYTTATPYGPVALLAEGVGRNLPTTREGEIADLSPSSRRAWVEIPLTLGSWATGSCRPPRGGRG